MKKAIFLFLITAIFAASGFAQTVKTKVPALPAGIADWKGEDSSKILDNAVIKARLKRLLGKKNYASFLESFETLNPTEKSGEILFSSGCLIHACGHLESAIAVDLVNNTIHAAIYNEEKKTRYFNEKGSKTPESIINWANRLSSLKDNKNQSSKGH